VTRADAAAAGASAPPYGVYVHFPFCSHRCPYCDFAVTTDRPPEAGRYLRGVLAELALRAGPFAGLRPVSLYVGGGTPSLWDPAELAALVRALRERLALPETAEATLEANPESVDPNWRTYFVGLGGHGQDVAHGPLIDALAQRAKVARPATAAAAGATPAPDSAAKQGAVSRMIQIYANRGHLIANLDPLGLTVRPVPKVLGLDYLNLGEADLDTEFYTGSRNEAIKPRLKLREIIAQLKEIYCGTVGAEFAHR